MIVMVECHLRAKEHRSALQMLQLPILTAETVMPPHKQDELFYLALKARSRQKCSPQLLLELLAMSMQQQTEYAQTQASELITGCLQDQDMQLASQVSCL